MNPLRRLRKFLFYLFLVIYLLLCPLLILHVLGYNLKVGGKRPIVATGDLYVVSFPPGARVIVDGKEYAKLTPTSVLNLEPGPHQLTLSLQDYIPWIDTVTIEEGKTAVLRDVLLLPRRWRQDELCPAVFQNILPMSAYPNLLLQQGPQLVDLFLYELQRKELVPLVDAQSPIARASIVSLVPLVNSSVLLIEAQQGSSSLRLLVTFQFGSATVEDLSDLIPEGIEGFWWDAENAKDLFFYRDGYVTRINVPSRTIHPRYPYRVRGFGVHNSFLYFLTLEGNMLRLDFDSKNVQSLDRFQGIGSLLPATGFVKITPRDDEVVIFRGQNGELITAGKGGTVALERIKGYRDDAHSSQVVLWQDQRLAVLHLDPTGGSGTTPPAVPRLQWISVSAINVEQAFFVLEGTHILLRDGKNLLLLGPERDGQRRKIPVAEIRRGTSMYYSDRMGRVYYIDSVTGKLASLQIIEKTQFVDQLLLDLREKLPP